MHARITTVQGSSDKVDAAIEKVKADVLPALQDADGFKGFTLHVDRSSGKMVGISYFDSEDALQASEAAVSAAREETARTAGGDASVDFFEVVIDTEA